MASNRRKHLALVQCFRAFAILFVLLGHVNSLFYGKFGYDWFNMGQWARTGGVDFFFVVSGFMIYYLYHDQIGEKGRASAFLIRRVIRIYPLYWIFTAAALAIFLHSLRSRTATRASGGSYSVPSSCCPPNPSWW